MNEKKVFTVRNMAMVGVMTALVFAGSWLKFTIPTPIDSTRLHLGNVMCLLSGLILGPLAGGLSAGFGSMFYDLTDPMFIASAPFTFVFKFFMAWICGKIAWGAGTEAKNQRRNLVAAIVGALSYVVLYLSKNFAESFFFLRMELSPIMISLTQKAIVSTINGVIAVVVAVPLGLALRKALDRANVFHREAKE